MKRKTSPPKFRQSYKPVNEALASFDNIDPALVGLMSIGKIIYANHSACELLGYPREELEGLQIQAITPGMTAADWSSFWLGLDQKDSKPARTTLHLSGKKELSVEFRALLTHPAGLKYCLMLIPEENPAAGVNEGTRNRQLAQVLNSLAEPVIVQDEQHKITFLNQAACQSFGTTVDRAAGTTVYDYMPKRYADLVWKREQKVLDSGSPITHVGDEFLQAKYGESVMTLLFLDPGTSRKRLLSIIKRAPHRAQAPPKVMLESHEPVPGCPAPVYLSELQENLAGNGHLGIFIKNTDNRYLWVNPAFARMTGLEIQDFKGKRTEDLVSDPEILAITRKEDDYLYSTGKPLFNQIVPLFNSKSGHYRLDKLPLLDRNGKLAGIIGLVVKIDDPTPPAEPLMKELESTSKKLSETETALRVLLDRREQDLSLTREQLSAMVRDQVLPYLEHLKQTQLTPEQAEFVGLIETNLKNFYDPAYARLSSPNYNLSPTELKVAQLIRDGKTNKEIANLLHLSKSTILTHRHHVRAKLGIRNKKVNLRSLLNS